MGGGQQEKRMALDGASSVVKLRSSDGEEYELAEEAAMPSNTLKSTLEDTGYDETIPVHNVKGAILNKVVEYCQYHVKHKKASEEGGAGAPTEEEKKSWDSQFVSVDQGTLFELILAANYLNIKPLLDLTCMTVAEMIKGKTPEEIRKTFNIKNDFTPEEEEEVRRENMWAFE